MVNQSKIEIEVKYGQILLEALEESLYKIALDLNELHTNPNEDKLQYLSKKQKDLEELQHLISIQIATS